MTSLFNGATTGVYPDAFATAVGQCYFVMEVTDADAGWRTDPNYQKCDTKCQPFGGHWEKNQWGTPECVLGANECETEYHEWDNVWGHYNGCDVTCQAQGAKLVRVKKDEGTAFEYEVDECDWTANGDPMGNCPDEFIRTVGGERWCDNSCGPFGGIFHANANGKTWQCCWANVDTKDPDAFQCGSDDGNRHAGTLSVDDERCAGVRADFSEADYQECLNYAAHGFQDPCEWIEENFGGETEAFLQCEIVDVEDNLHDGEVNQNKADPCEHAKQEGEDKYFECFKNHIGDYVDDLEGRFDELIETLNHLSNKSSSNSDAIHILVGLLLERNSSLLHLNI